MARLGNTLGIITRPSALKDELRRSTAAVRALFDSAVSSCALVENVGEEIRFVAANGAGTTLNTGRALPIERGIAGWVAMTGQPIAIANVSVDPRFARDVAAESNYVPTTVLAVPLLGDDDEVLNVIDVLDPRATGGGTGPDLDILGLICSQLVWTVRLARMVDLRGSVLFTTLADASNVDDFARALYALVDASGDRGGLVEIAADSGRSPQRRQQAMSSP